MEMKTSEKQISLRQKWNKATNVEVSILPCLLNSVDLNDISIRNYFQEYPDLLWYKCLYCRKF